METVNGEVYLALHHPQRDEDMHVWFDEKSGDFLRGHVHFPDGSVTHFPTFDHAEAALLGVAL